VSEITEQRIVYACPLPAVRGIIERVIDREKAKSVVT